MIVLDVETTGVNPEKCSILSIGAVDMNEPTHELYLECRAWDGAHVEPEALVVNGYSEKDMRDPSKMTETEAVSKFFEWLADRTNIMIAAQNPLFDIGFVQAAAARGHINFPLSHRSVDLHATAYVHMVGQGIEPPTKNRRSDINSDSIMAYVGIPAEPKPHIAINGAIWEAEALSRLLYGKNLLEKFASYPLPWVKG
jgi:DNA polymerase III epsilon subunit-like protein